MTVRVCVCVCARLCLLIFYDIQVPYVCVHMCVSRVFVFPPGKSKHVTFAPLVLVVVVAVATVVQHKLCELLLYVVAAHVLCSPGLSLSLSRSHFPGVALFCVRSSEFAFKVKSIEIKLIENVSEFLFFFFFFLPLFRVCIFVATYFHKQM